MAAKRTAAELKEMSRKHYPQFLDLMVEAGIDIDRPDSWELLAVVLANRMRLLGKRSRVGRKITWGPDDKASLIRDFDEAMKAHGCNANKAAELLQRDKARKWWRYSADSLEARYSAFKSEAARRAMVKEISAELDAERRSVQN